MTDNPEPASDRPAPAERAARAAAVLRAAEAAAAALDDRAPASAPPGPAGGRDPGREEPGRREPGAPPSSSPPAPPAASGRDAREGAAALAELFAATGAPERLARGALARLGPDAADRLRADPWRLLGVPGVRPAQADHFARAVLGDAAGPGDPRRGRALVLHLLTEAARAGHTVTPAADVVEALERARVPDPRAAVEAALDEAEVLSLTEEPEFGEESFEEDAEPEEPEEMLGAARWALAEEAAAEGFQRLTLTAAPLVEDAALKELRGGLPEDRSLALTAALRTGVSVLRGDPDGIAAAAAGIAGAAAGAGLRAAVAAPTDLAAAALPAPEGVAVTGLHRLLEPREAPGGVVYGRGEQHPLDLDLLVVSDASALDVELCAALAEACPDGAHLVLCAEPGAAPPAGPGRPLDDLEASETVPVVTLDAAPPDGPLGVLTAAVRGGDLPAVDAPDREVVIVPAADPGEAVHRAVQLVTDSIPRALGIPAGDVQAVAPAAGGPAGAGALNAALKARLNPGPGAFGGMDPGDRVVVAAPLAQAAVGETGTVAGGGPHGLDVDFPAGPATVAPADAARLRHGWAVPVALARGTRRPAVVAVLPAEGLSRPLVATAFGLATRHLSVVQAAGPALAAAVRDGVPRPRRTRLASLVVQ
ncbi:exodeoxyribonuclease V alpha subunit [Actinomadura meyerae]|uniref:Exodeoxyribonuclease V alpha subunit n=1 Tax=Actinomadura meyerae TaxID=240840 RepID=A0A239GY08_9ACTN|nr:helix-hairpin-helix domain-containing protein [Actinomadura meyerae]SNS73792.1 exodeoxyribonuclease V alpha subunit [Actinomadura meyerae]